MRWMMTLLLAGAIASPASPHDFWLQPQSWQASLGVPMPVTVEVGHAEFRQNWGGGADRLITLADVTQSGTTDLRSYFRAGGTQPHLDLPFRKPGMHILTMVSTQALSDLPALRFNDYIKFEGITPALEYRARTNKSETPGRERYSRRCKALVQVGQTSAKDDDFATRNLGMSLEIVPERSPYNLDSSRMLPVKVFFEGRPLAGALVKLTNLEYDAKPLLTGRTDSAGRVLLRVPPVSSWLVSVIWTKPIVAKDADFETTFASLTFGYSPKRNR